MCTNPIFLSEPYYNRKNFDDKFFHRLKLGHSFAKDFIPLPCGKCPECLKARSDEWTMRLKLELMEHEASCFITLTYSDTDGELCKRDYQLFLKRLRKYIYPKKIRYFLCGEYGSKKKRPHFHCLIFGYIFDDLRFFYEKKGIKYYLSETLSKLWNNGYVLVQRIDDNCLKYVTKYMQKLVSYDDKTVKPFVAMSNRPGIAFNYVEKLKEDNSDNIFLNGRRYRYPRYFLKKLVDLGFSDTVEYIKEMRILRSYFRCKLDLINSENKFYKSITRLKIKM